MPSQRNVNQVQDLTEKLSTAKAVVLTDYSGLSVNQQRALRQKVTEVDGQFLVAKNTLFKLALSAVGKKNLYETLKDSLQGPTAFLFAFKDELNALKTLVQFSSAEGLPKTKAGILFTPQVRVLSADEIETLAKLPGYDQLIVRLITTLNAPKYRLVNVLAANLRRLPTILSAIKDSKGSN